MTTLRIGGIRVSLTGGNPSPPGDNRYLPFQEKTFSPGVDWRVRPGPPPPGLPSPAPGLNRWTVSRWKKKKLFQLYLDGSPRRRWKAALMEEDCSRGDIWWDRKLASARAGPFFCLDIFLWAHLLLARNGLIVHAAALRREGAVYLFPGPSGSGKSTWSELAARDPAGEVLGEDKVILRRAGDDYVISGSPWNPRPAFRSAARGTLRGIYFLHPGGENGFTPLSAPATFQRLLQASFLPFTDPADMERVLALLEPLSGMFPGSIFSFRPDPSALPFWREGR